MDTSQSARTRLMNRIPLEQLLEGALQIWFLQCRSATSQCPLMARAVGKRTIQELASFGNGVLTRKGVKKMSYAKPELTEMAQAGRAIHGEPKKNGTPPDNDGGFVTVPAYESDE